MKKTMTVALLVVLTLVLSTSTFAGTKILSEEKYNTAKENYLVGIKSDNFGLKTSSAYYLGELESTEAVIPLLSILSNDKEDVRTRITAALALYKIGDGRGIYRLKRTAQFEENERLSELSEKFYLTHKLQEMGYDEEIDENSLREYVQNVALYDMFH